jgi:ion channel-forming bestrophin family protein
LIHFLPQYVNGKPNEIEKLPLWCDDEDYDGQSVNTPATELGRDQTPDSSEKFTAMQARNDGYDPENALPQVQAERPLKPARNPPSTSILDLIPLLRIFPWIGHKLFRKGHAAKHNKKDAYVEYVESNIPLEIILILSK